MVGASAICGGGVAECCRGRSIVYWREHLQGQTGIKASSSKTEQPGQDEAGEARKDGIRGQDQNKSKKLFRKRGFHIDWQSAVVSSRKAAQDLKIKSV